ncbi:MAG: histone H1 [Candidatus Cyclobacteriaceae bacterium M3_2C_046]
MKKFNDIKELINSAEGDADKFYTKGNKAAGTRLRKTMLEIKDLAHEIRKEVTDIKNK